MLPTQGLFRSIPCPYYISGLCERPQCLFRHTKSDVILARKIEIEEDEEQEQERVSGGEGDLPTGGINVKECVEPGGQHSRNIITGRKRKAAEGLLLNQEGSNKSICLDSVKNGEARTRLEAETEVIKVKKEDIEIVDLTEGETELKPNKSEIISSRKNKSSRHKSSSKSSKSSRSSSSHKSRSHSSKSDKEKEGKSSHSKINSADSPSKHRSQSSTSSTKRHSSHKSSSHKDKSNSIRLKNTESPSKNSILESDVASPQCERKDSAVQDNCETDKDPNPSDIEPLSDYEDDPEDIELECLKLFENYKPEEKAPETKIVIGNSSVYPESHNFQKRQAHPGAERSVGVTKNNSLPKAIPKTSTGLHSIISKRIESQRNNPVTSSIPTVGPSNSSTESRTLNLRPATSALNKKRIAHVANVTVLLRSSPSSVPDKSPEKSGASDSNKTIPKTTVKGTNRVAHLYAQDVKKKRPIVNIDSPSKGSGKIPTSIRQRILDQLFDSAVKIYTPQEAFKRAVEDEAAIEIRSKTKAVYLSLAVGKVRAIRKEAEEEPSEGAGAASSDVLSGSSQSPRPSDKGNFSILTRNVVKPTGTALYQCLKRFVLTEDLLVSNGFPRRHPGNEPGRVVAKPSHWDKEYISLPNRRTCDRCNKVYDVTEIGQQLREDMCTFHPGRKSYHRVNRVWLSQRSCCGDESGSDGCTITNYHVPKAHPPYGGFVAAVKYPGSEDHMGLDPWDIVAIDCEMIYTTGGNLLARATFVGSDGTILFDQLVRPPYPVLDYNTEYSGITAEMMFHATASLTDVQAVLLTHLKPNALLIGHSLESDLIALRVRHDYVLDTSVLYPHKRGPPYKRALRMLSSDYLHKIIQNSADGHDSAEDARAALHLAILHIDRARNGDVS